MRPGSGPYFALISLALRPDAKNCPSDDVLLALPHTVENGSAWWASDDPRQGVGVGFGTQIPGAGPRQLRMAHAVRRVRHARSEVGRAGENRGEERRRIGVDAPGAQIGKRVEEPRSGVHIPQQVGDPDTRHERIDRAVKAFARGRGEGVVGRDLEAAVLETDAFEATGGQLRAHLAQPVVEPLAPAFEPGRSVRLQCSVAEDALRFVRGHKVGVESTVVPAAFDPDVAGAKLVTQRGRPQPSRRCAVGVFRCAESPLSSACSEKASARCQAVCACPCG